MRCDETGDVLLTTMPTIGLLAAIERTPLVSARVDYSCKAADSRGVLLQTAT
jgi:hypothetical protein